MAFDFKEFDGSTPYASELFGVYQPLLGWRSNLGRQRVTMEGARITDEIIRDVVDDLRTRPTLQFDPREPVTAISPLAPLIQNAIRESFQQFVRSEGRPPTSKEWPAVVERAQFEGRTTVATGRPIEGLRTLRALGLSFAPAANLSSADLVSRAWHPVEGTDLYLARSLDLGADDEEAREERELAAVRLLSGFAPEVLHTAFTGNRFQVSRWLKKLPYIDPLSQFDGTAQDALLSPIGVLHLFREYFFEGKSFAGPAVGHVWLSPGSTLELYEVHTRKRIEERRVEVGLEATRRSESSETEQDDLSTAVSEQNGRNTNLGVTASGGVNFGVVQSSTSASISLGQTRQSTQQTARKQLRQQSETLASEMRKSFKTSFRTSTEIEDTESRRYVLSNTTGHLLNYELRRKMRRVGVQVQRLGAQLCWQVYVDDPGIGLAIPELVHIAKPSDLDGVPPPEAPPPLPARETELVYDFPFDSIGAIRNPDSVRYAEGSGWTGIFGNQQVRIVGRRRVQVLPPEPGYELATVQVGAIDRIDPEKEPPDASVRVERATASPRLHFDLVLAEVNFREQPALRINLKIGWTPTQKAQDDIDLAYSDAVKQFKAEKSRAAHIAYVDAVRERVRLAGQVQRRPADDLREEERTVVYRRVVERLTAAEPTDTGSQRHVVAELIRTFFDVDRMLYFVAEEWWNPRKRPAQQHVVPTSANSPGGGPTDHLGPQNRVNWGGVSGSRGTYLVTEDSAPAPLGASLGWILQLDGDAHRNAFLNSPWVKAVIPIRRGREHAALEWLRRAEVEGQEGLDQTAAGLNTTVGEALEQLAREIANEEGEAEAVRAADRLFEHGFDPLEGGTTVPPPFPVFDAWIEVLPTDQVIAVEYEPEA